MKIQIFLSETCPACNYLKNQFLKSNKKYDNIEIIELGEYALTQILKNAGNFKVPCAVVDGNYCEIKNISKEKVTIQCHNNQSIDITF